MVFACLVGEKDYGYGAWGERQSFGVVIGVLVQAFRCRDNPAPKLVRAPSRKHCTLGYDEHGFKALCYGIGTRCG